MYTNWRWLSNLVQESIHGAVGGRVVSSWLMCLLKGSDRGLMLTFVLFLIRTICYAIGRTGCTKQSKEISFYCLVTVFVSIKYRIIINNSCEESLTDGKTKLFWGLPANSNFCLFCTLPRLLNSFRLPCGHTVFLCHLSVYSYVLAFEIKCTCIFERTGAQQHEDLNISPDMTIHCNMIPLSHTLDR